MCGIIGYVGAQQAAPILLEGLRRLEYRGYDSAGVAVVGASAQPNFEVRRCEGKLARLEQAMAENMPAGSLGIGHTRWATHGGPTETNAHPHRVGDVSVVHNGIIENHRKLRAELEARGRTLASDTDSEVIAHLVDEEYAVDRQLHAAVRRAIARLDGAWALAVVHLAHPGQIVAARNACPLIIGLGDTAAVQGAANNAAESFVTSDVAAILARTRNVVDLSDGDTVLVAADGVVEHLDVDGELVRRAKRQIDWSPTAAEKQGFKHFMLKEIFEQPRCIRDTMMGSIVEHGERLDVDLDGFDVERDRFRRIKMLACGTSWHAALVGKYLIEGIARIPTEVELASEFRYSQPIIGEGDLAVAISQSGETADTLAALREAQRLGAHGLAVCNVVDSTIARSSDDVLYTHAGPEISVASTKAFTTQLTMLSLLALRLGRVQGTVDASEADGFLQGLRNLPKAVSEVLATRSAIKTIARRYASARDFLFLGRGTTFPAALEGALKLKEISYVHAEGYAAGEMKHGPIALIDEHMPVVVLVQRGPGYEKSLANLEEVRSRGGRVIAVATVGDDQIGDIVEDVILVPEVDPRLQAIIASIPLQLLAYYIADLKGTDVDQPRNLAKSVTVE